MMLFMDAFESFKKNMENLGGSKLTIKEYTSYLNRFCKYLNSKYNRAVYIDEVTADDLDKYIFSELGEGEYSSSTRHNMITAFKSLYSFCYRKGYCNSNIGKSVKNIKVETPERDCISEVEFARLVKEIPSATVYAVVYTLFYTGLRISECLSLTLSDVDFTNSVIMVREGKGRKDRNIPMHPKLKGKLIEYMNDYRYNIGTDNFFATKSGKLCCQYANRVLKKATEKAGINKKVSCHVLRHSFISNLIHKGGSLLRVQKLSGHKSIKTIKTYLHTSFEELQDAVNLL